MSLLDNEIELLGDTNAMNLMGVPKFNDIDTSPTTSQGVFGKRIVKKSYVWTIPKALRKNYNINNIDFKKAHPEFNPYKLILLIDPNHSRLSLKIYATERNSIYNRIDASEYEIGLYMWNISNNIRSKYKTIAYNILELLATHQNALQYILADTCKDYEYNYFFYGINVNLLFERFNWKIKTYK